MAKPTIDDMVEWIKGSLDVLANSAQDNDDPNQRQALSIISTFAEDMGQWMDEMYGDGGR